MRHLMAENYDHLNQEWLLIQTILLLAVSPMLMGAYQRLVVTPLVEESNEDRTRLIQVRTEGQASNISNLRGPPVRHTCN